MRLGYCDETLLFSAHECTVLKEIEPDIESVSKFSCLACFKCTLGAPTYLINTFSHRGEILHFNKAGQTNPTNPSRSSTVSRLSFTVTTIMNPYLSGVRSPSCHGQLVTIVRIFNKSL